MGLLFQFAWLLLELGENVLFAKEIALVKYACNWNVLIEQKRPALRLLVKGALLIKKSKLTFVFALELKSGKRVLADLSFLIGFQH